MVIENHLTGRRIFTTSIQKFKNQKLKANAQNVFQVKLDTQSRQQSSSAKLNKQKAAKNSALAVSWGANDL